MAEQLSPELIATLDARVEKIRADYNERLEKDREFIRSLVGKVSFAAALVASFAAYFGITGFDDLVDRAVQKTNPREKWEAVLDDVRDHALVNAMVTSRESRRGAYTPLELEAFNRLLKNPATREQMFVDVVSLLKDFRRARDVGSTLEVMENLLAGRGNSEWVRKSPRKQQLLISYLAERKFDAASPTVLPYLDSHDKAVQLAAIRFAKECQIAAAAERMSRLMKQHGTDDIGAAAAIALVAIAPTHTDAKKWLAALKERSNASMEEAARALRQLGSFAKGPEAVRTRYSQARSDAPPVAAGSSDALTEVIVSVVRSAMLKGYFLTFGEYFDRPGEYLLYLARDEKTWSEEDIQTHLLSPSVVDKLLRAELAGGNMENFKRFVRGLSGISTDRDVNDMQREVVFVLEQGAIELDDGNKFSKSLSAGTADLSWAIRQWKLKVDDSGELIGESVAVPRLRGKVREITLARDSVFILNTSAAAAEPSRRPARPLARAEIASAPATIRD